MAYIPINTSVRSRTELSRLWNKGSGKPALTYCQGDLDPQGLGGGSGSVVCALTSFTVSHILFITHYSLFLKPFLLNLKHSEEKWNAWKTKGLVQGGADSTPQQEVEAECPYTCGHAEPTLSFCSHLLRKWGNIAYVHSDVGIQRMLCPGKELELQWIHSVILPCFSGVVSGSRTEKWRIPAVRCTKVMGQGLSRWKQLTEKPQENSSHMIQTREKTFYKTKQISIRSHWVF